MCKSSEHYNRLNLTGLNAKFGNMRLKRILKIVYEELKRQF
jgi:hypothetical protein